MVSHPSPEETEACLPTFGKEAAAPACRSLDPDGTVFIFQGLLKGQALEELCWAGPFEKNKAYIGGEGGGLPRLWVFLLLTASGSKAHKKQPRGGSLALILLQTLILNFFLQLLFNLYICK